MYDQDKPMKMKKEKCRLPKEGYEMKVSQIASKEPMYSKDNAKEYAKSIRKQEAYVKKNMSNHA